MMTAKTPPAKGPGTAKKTAAAAQKTQNEKNGGLIHERSGERVARRLIKAETFKERLTGLCGKEDMPQETAFWIPECPSIHTFFMKFPLDLIFTDKNLRVVSVFQDVSPYKIIFGGFRARHVFEMKAKKDNKTFLLLKKGDGLKAAPAPSEKF